MKMPASRARAPTLASPASRIGQEKGISGVGDISSVGHPSAHC
jgi:hypothetical protein